MRLSDTSITSIKGLYSEVRVSARDKDKKETEVDGMDYLEFIRREMRQAASSEDYVTAGELQKKVRLLEDLKRRIKAAADEENYVVAGELQSQYRGLTGVEATGVEAKRKILPPPVTSSSDIPGAKEK